MAAVYYTSSSTYEVVVITTAKEADKDLQTVKHLITDCDNTKYLSNMYKAIEQTTARAILKDGVKVGFVYCTKVGCKYYGSSIHIPDDFIAMLLGFKEVFDMIDSHKIEVVPHINGLKNFISIATGASIRSYNAGIRRTIVVLREDMLRKGDKMYKYLGIK